MQTRFCPSHEIGNASQAGRSIILVSPSPFASAFASTQLESQSSSKVCPTFSKELAMSLHSLYLSSLSAILCAIEVSLSA